MTEQRLGIDEIIQCVQFVASTQPHARFDPQSQTLHFMDESAAPVALRMPLVFPSVDSNSIEELRAQLGQAGQVSAIVLIQAGAAAIGIWERGELTRHRIIKKYMVRKCQGKSQITYLKSRGKSRAGSRIRLSNSISFFEEINEALQQWDVSTRCETILMSLPVNLKNLMFNSNVPTPFDKKDRRIRKIPMDIHTPSFKELQHITWMVSRGTLISR